MWNYLVHIATTALALLYLVKDWEQHNKSCLRLSILTLIILIGIGGIFNTYHTNIKNDDQRQKDQKQIASLSKEIETAKNLTLARMDELKTLILYKSNSQEAQDWISIKLPYPIAILPEVKAVYLIIKSPEGMPVEGFLKGEGFDLEYPFDSALNDKQPIAVKIKQPYIKFRIVSPKDKNIPYSIEATGYYLPR